MAKVKYRVREFTPKANQAGTHSWFAEAVVANEFSNIELSARIAQRTGFKEYEVQAVVVEDDVEMVACTRRAIAPDVHVPQSKAGRPGACAFALADLPKGVHLRFDVRPIECFGKKGQPISSDGAFVA